MNKLEYIQKINRYFPYLVLQIHTSTASGLFDINSVAEDFYLPILRLLYGCPSLENKNVIQYNFPAVDLACNASRKSFQITSENGSDKIIHTLKKFRDNNLDKEYDELWILVITSKQKSYLSKKLDEEIKNQKISFDKNVHIIDYTDIVAKISQLPTNELEAIFKILEAEFSKQESFSICRDELDNFLEISNAKIEVEKNTKKYIPAIFTESTKTKDIARLFVHPVFFYRKIEDKLSSINYDLLNEFLSMMGMAEIQSAIPSYIEATSPKNIQELPSILTALEKLIKTEIEKIAPFNPSGKSDPRPDFKVPAGKEAIKSLLKHQRELLCYGIANRYGDALDRIKLCNAKILLITSMAGQGKTNFVCDLIENQFKAFEIPSIFIPARELNSVSTSPQIFNHIKKNRYLSSITDGNPP